MTVTTTDVRQQQDADDTLILRDASDITLEDVVAEWSRSYSSASVDIDRVNVRLTEDEPTITFGEHEVPSTAQGIEALGRQLGMPINYLLKVPADEQQFMLEHRLQRSEAARVRIEYNSNGIQSLNDERHTLIEPERMASIVARQMPLESPVRDHRMTPTEVQLDVYAPGGETSWWVGGDRLVGDITHGGVRVWQDRKNGRMPEVSTFLYRLVCTNGMEIPTLARIEGRRGDIQDAFDAEFESLVATALGNVTSSIDAYYDMRNQPVGADPTGVMRRMASDHGLSARATAALEDRVAQFEDPTMFDFLNLVTNTANLSPVSRYSRTLQRVGGQMLTDHRARCGTCHRTLV